MFVTLYVVSDTWRSLQWRDMLTRTSRVGWIYL